MQYMSAPRTSSITHEWPVWAHAEGYRRQPTFSEWQQRFRKELSPHTNAWCIRQPTLSGLQAYYRKPLNPHTTDWYNPFGLDADLNLAEEERIEKFMDDLATTDEYDNAEPLSPEEEALCDAWEEQQRREEDEERARRPCSFPLRVLQAPNAYLRTLPLFCSEPSRGSYCRQQ